MAQVRLSGTQLVFGCVPDLDDDATRMRLADLCESLSQRLGRRVLPHRSPSPRALASAFRAGRVTVAWVSPASLLTSRDLAQAVPLVCSVRQGLTAYHGCLYVKSDSEIRSPAELAGTRAAWVAPSSAAGFIFPRLTLAGYGFDPRTLFAEESFHGSHGQVAQAVLSGRSDVGAGYAVFENGNPTSTLVRAPFLDQPGATGRILLATSPIPSDLIVAARSLSAVLRALLTRSLEELGDDHLSRAALAHVLGVESFVRHTPDSLAALREQIDVGRRLELLDDSVDE